jgi:Zn finger protein HypA/HybF involved in hydrogenase expression
MITVLMTIVLMSPAMLMALKQDKRRTQPACVLCKQENEKEEQNAICKDCYSQLHNR